MKRHILSTMAILFFGTLTSWAQSITISTPIHSVPFKPTTPLQTWQCSGTQLGITNEVEFKNTSGSVVSYVDCNGVIHPSGGGGMGTAVEVNGSAALDTANFNDTTPSVSACSELVNWQTDGTNVSAEELLNLGNQCNVLDANKFSGASWYAKVSAAQTALCAAYPDGGIITTQSLVGAQTLPTSLTIGTTPCTVIVKTGPMTLTASSGAGFTISPGSYLWGAGIGATTIVGAAQTVAVKMGGPGAHLSDVTIESTIPSPIESPCIWVPGVSNVLIERVNAECQPGIISNGTNNRYIAVSAAQIFAVGESQWNQFDGALAQPAQYPSLTRIMEVGTSADAGTDVYVDFASYADGLGAFIQTPGNIIRGGWFQDGATSASTSSFATWAATTAYGFGQLVTDGKIRTTTLDAGGSGYAVSDTGTVNNAVAGATLATYVVNTVDGGGGVLTYTITGFGNGYSAATGIATTDAGAQPGVGVGFTINITGLKGLVMMCYTNAVLSGANPNLTTPSCGGSGATTPTWDAMSGNLTTDGAIQWLNVTGYNMVFDGGATPQPLNNNVARAIPLFSSDILYSQGADINANSVGTLSSTNSFYAMFGGLCMGGSGPGRSNCEENPYATLTLIDGQGPREAFAAFGGGINTNSWWGLAGVYAGNTLWDMGSSYNYGNAQIDPCPQPAAPILGTAGTPGATSYTFYIVAHCPGSLESIPSAPATITTGNAAPDATNYVTILPPVGTQLGSGQQEGYWANNTKWDVLLADTSHSILLNQNLAIGGFGNAFSVTPLKYTGQGTSAYVALTSPAPETFSVNGGFTLLGGPFTIATTLPAAAAGNKGLSAVVSDSTAVAVEGQTCAGSDAHTALAFSDGTVWKCF